MPRNDLPEELTNSLGKAGHFTTLHIILGNDSALRFSSIDIADIGGFPYLGKLEPLDALNLELTRATELIQLRISNVTKTLGQTLMNTPNILNKTTAFLGVYIRNIQSEQAWDVVKMKGEIEVGDTANEWIPVMFKSKAAKRYNGQTIMSFFPNSEIPVQTRPNPPQPVYDDLQNHGGGIIGNGLDERYYDYQHREYYGRYVLPDFQVQMY